MQQAMNQNADLSPWLSTSKRDTGSGPAADAGSFPPPLQPESSTHASGAAPQAQVDPEFEAALQRAMHATFGHRPVPQTDPLANAAGMPGLNKVTVSAEWIRSATALPANPQDPHGEYMMTPKAAILADAVLRREAAVRPVNFHVDEDDTYGNCDDDDDDDRDAYDPEQQRRPESLGFANPPVDANNVARIRNCAGSACAVAVREIVARREIPIDKLPAEVRAVCTHEGGSEEVVERLVAFSGVFPGPDRTAAYNALDIMRGITDRCDLLRDVAPWTEIPVPSSHAPALPRRFLALPASEHVDLGNEQMRMLLDAIRRPTRSVVLVTPGSHVHRCAATIEVVVCNVGGHFIALVLDEHNSVYRCYDDAKPVTTIQDIGVATSCMRRSIEFMVLRMQPVIGCSTAARDQPDAAPARPAQAQHAPDVTTVDSASSLPSQSSDGTSQSSQSSYGPLGHEAPRPCAQPAAQLSTSMPSAPATGTPSQTPAAAEARRLAACEATKAATIARGVERRAERDRKEQRQAQAGQNEQQQHQAPSHAHSLIDSEQEDDAPAAGSEQHQPSAAAAVAAPTEASTSDAPPAQQSQELFTPAESSSAASSSMHTCSGQSDGADLEALGGGNNGTQMAWSGAVGAVSPPSGNSAATLDIGSLDISAASASPSGDVPAVSAHTASSGGDIDSASQAAEAVSSSTHQQSPRGDAAEEKRAHATSHSACRDDDPDADDDDYVDESNYCGDANSSAQRPEGSQRPQRASAKQSKSSRRAKAEASSTNPAPGVDVKVPAGSKRRKATTIAAPSHAAETSTTLRNPPSEDENIQHAPVNKNTICEPTDSVMSDNHAATSTPIPALPAASSAAASPEAIARAAARVPATVARERKRKSKSSSTDSSARTASKGNSIARPKSATQQQEAAVLATAQRPSLLRRFLNAASRAFGLSSKGPARSSLRGSREAVAAAAAASPQPPAPETRRSHRASAPRADPSVTHHGAALPASSTAAPTRHTATTSSTPESRRQRRVLALAAQATANPIRVPTRTPRPLTPVATHIDEVLPGNPAPDSSSAPRNERAPVHATNCTTDNTSSQPRTPPAPSSGSAAADQHQHQSTAQGSSTRDEFDDDDGRHSGGRPR
jgi:hypothetical protein